MNRSKKISGCFVIPGRNCSVLLQFCKKIFYQMSRFIPFDIIFTLFFAIRLGGNDRFYT